MHNSLKRMWALLGVGQDVRRFTELAETTRQACPLLVPWMTAHPLQVLGLEHRRNAIEEEATTTAYNG